MKLSNFNDKIVLIDPWAEEKQATLEEASKSASTDKEKAAIKAETRNLNGVLMGIDMCDGLTDSEADQKERGTFWAQIRTCGSKFDDWPVESKNTNQNLSSEQKLFLANEQKHQKPIVKAILQVEGAKTILQRIFTPSARVGGWYSEETLEAEMNKALDKVTKTAFKAKGRVNLKFDAEKLSTIKAPPLKPKIKRTKKADKEKEAKEPDKK
tara:strand:+ start:110 stop:742 length:633 start_codon:yes stop_codon:yes gene_type:complete